MLDDRDTEGNSLLHYCVKWRSVEAARVLCAVSCHSRPSADGYMSCAPVRTPAYPNTYSSGTYPFAQHGIDPDAVNVTGKSAAGVAACIPGVQQLHSMLHVQKCCVAVFAASSPWADGRLFSGIINLNESLWDRCCVGARSCCYA